ncbi:MAG TPA: HlyD family efflux transporter periplasmic adaptor subunit [Candidatus Limnocylindrales bacterium]
MITRSRGIIAVIVVIAVVAVIWLLSSTGAAGPDASASPTLGPVPESDVVAADARVVPVRRAELSAPGGGGVVAEVLVAEGDRVTAGQPLLRLDGSRLEPQLAGAQAAVAAAEAHATQADASARQADAQVSVAEAGVDQAQAALAAADATRDAGPSSGAARRAANAEVDRARAGVRSARAQVTAARRAADAAGAGAAAAAAEVDRSRAAAADLQAAIDELTLVAPFAGLVASLDAVAGETVAAGSPIVRIADPTGWRFETVDLDEAAIGRLAEGAEATVSVDAFPDVEIPARVVSIAPFGESSAGDIVYAIVLEPIGEVPDGLRWNMTASAQSEADR